MPLDVFSPVYGTPLKPIQPVASGNTRTQYAGMYVQDRVELNPRLFVTAGGRLDFASNRDLSKRNANGETAFSPRLGASYRVLQTVSVFSGYSRSFRPQNGLIYDGSANGAFAAAETGDQWEVGVKTSFLSNRMINSLSVYRLTRGDVLTPDPGHPAFSLLTGRQRSSGAEVETTFLLHGTWNLTFAYAFTNAHVVADTVIRAGTPTQNAPMHGVNVWTTYELQRGWIKGVGFGVGARHYSEQSGDPRNTFSIPGYGLLDAAIFYRRGPLEWQLHVRNLTDTRYFAGSYNDVYVLPGSPRSVHTTLTWRVGAADRRR